MSDASIPAPAPETPSPQQPKTGKGIGCLGIIILICVIVWIADMAGCGSEGYRVGPNGATAYPANTALGGSIHLEPGTKVQPIEKVGDRSWRYEIKEGQYEGNYAVIFDNEVE